MRLAILRLLATFILTAFLAAGGCDTPPPATPVATRPPSPPPPPPPPPPPGAQAGDASSNPDAAGNTDQPGNVPASPTAAPPADSPPPDSGTFTTGLVRHRPDRRPYSFLPPAGFSMQEPEYSEKGILAGNYMAIFQYASGDPPTKTMQLYIQIKAEETDGSPADLEKMCKFVRERQISGPGLRPGGERDMQGNLGAGRILEYTQVDRRLDQVRNSVGVICIQIRPGYFVTVNGTAWNYDASQIQAAVEKLATSFKWDE